MPVRCPRQQRGMQRFPHHPARGKQLRSAFGVQIKMAHKLYLVLLVVWPHVAQDLHTLQCNPLTLTQPDVTLALCSRTCSDMRCKTDLGHD